MPDRAMRWRFPIEALRCINRVEKTDAPERFFQELVENGIMQAPLFSGACITFVARVRPCVRKKRLVY